MCKDSGKWTSNKCLQEKAKIKLRHKSVCSNHEKARLSNLFGMNTWLLTISCEKPRCDMTNNNREPLAQISDPWSGAIYRDEDSVAKASNSDSFTQNTQ